MVFTDGAVASVEAAGTNARSIDALSVLNATRVARRWHQVTARSGPTGGAHAAVVHATSIGAAVRLARKQRWNVKQIQYNHHLLTFFVNCSVGYYISDTIELEFHQLEQR